MIKKSNADARGCVYIKNLGLKAIPVFHTYISISANYQTKYKALIRPLFSPLKIAK